MSNHKFPHQKRPRWWPENESWPPTGMQRGRFRGHFFRRVGCLFLLFNVFISVIVLILAGALANLMGIIQLPGSFQWAILLAGVVFLLGFFFLAWVGRTLRRMSMPLDDLIAAADQIAQGDYSVRVKEQGPPEVRSLGRVFNSMASRLKDIDDQRRNLLADITHELRTPITVIQGNVEGVLDGVYEADEAHLKSILEEIHLLSRLVDDLRTLALAESGALQLEKEPTDLSVLISESAAELRPQFDEAGVTLGIDLPADAPLLSIDPERVRQVLVNLIVNALRHTPPGESVRVHFEMLSTEEAQVIVEDTGTGIRPDDLPHIFDRFFKTKDSTGMGLGLAIAKNLVQAHGGTIQAKSQLGVGTIFSVTLPA
jgi:signal transduction histidine kinase